MEGIVKGRVWKLGDDVNTDVIFPGKYTYTIQEPEEMEKHALEDLIPDFVEKVQEGDVIVGGKNFGCGSSREQAVICLKAAGIRAIIARSFARIYFRNAINQGLAIIQCPELVDTVEDKDEITVDLRKGVIIHNGKEYSFPPLPEEIMEILNAGGLIPYVRHKVGAE